MSGKEITETKLTGGREQKCLLGDIRRFANEMSKKYENTPELKGLAMLHFFNTLDATIPDPRCAQLLGVLDDTVNDFRDQLAVYHLIKP